MAKDKTVSSAILTQFSVQLFTCALIWTLIALTSGCASSRRVGGETPALQKRAIPSMSPLPDLKASLDAFLPDSLFPPSNVGIMVVSLADSRTLYELNPDLFFMPASNEKLFTSAAALSLLGRDYHFPTSVSVDTADVPGIYLRGSGDPLLSTADLDSLARMTATLLAHHKSWLLGGDVSFFDDIPWGEGWMWDDEAEPDGMAITPLSLNGNTVHVEVRGGNIPGDTVSVTLDPPTGYITIENKGLTVADTTGQPLQVTRRPTDQSGTILVSGTLRPCETLSTDVAVHEPAWYTLRVFSELLGKYGIRCSGMVLDTLPATARPVCGFYHTLDTIVTYMNRVSDNLSAECLLKTMGAVTAKEPGTAASGIASVRRFLAGQGLDTTRMIMVDGSGVSRYNLNTARGITGLLQAMYHNQALFPLYFNSLAAPGEHGSLSHRMTGTTAEKNLRAKTGTLRGATAFSGYVSGADGKMLAFSIIMQNFNGNLRSYRQVQDRIGVHLSQWRKNE
jgi:serine-type D-Ala-D-Ala carboxypeptidase/endopeptidase (penicillin-binding protein 4)